MKTALIWGASGGIGQAITRRLIQDNWQVLAAGRHLESLTDLSEFTYDVDLSDTFSIQSAITVISQEVSEVNLWVYAAGDIAHLKVNEMRPVDWQRIIQANLTGAYMTTHFSWPLFSEQSHLFYLGAYSERLHLPGLSAYAAAKAGMEAFTDVVRKESRHKVTLVRPGAVDTPFWAKVPFGLPSRHLKPEDVAEKIVQAYHDGHQGQLDL